MNNKQQLVPSPGVLGRLLPRPKKYDNGYLKTWGSKPARPNTTLVVEVAEVIPQAESYCSFCDYRRPMSPTSEKNLAAHIRRVHDNV